MKNIKNTICNILALELSIIICLSLVACTVPHPNDNQVDDTVQHEHTYSKTYYFSWNKHFKKAVCGCENVPLYLEEPHNLVDNKCTVCEYKISEGLKFELNSDEASYKLVGRGSCNDEYIGVPSTYENLPVTAVAASAFKGDDKLKGIAFSLGITSLPNSVFANCYNLSIVGIPEGVKSLGSSLFTSCAFEYIELPSTLETIGHGSFNQCSLLKEIVIPNNVTQIVKGSFNSNKSLKYAYIGNKVELLGERTFVSCSALTKVVLGSSVKTILADSFNNCHNLKEVHIDSLEHWVNIDMSGQSANPLFASATCKLYLNGSAIEEIVVPESITVIKQGAFQNILSAKKIVIHKNVTEIGMLAFSGCTGVKEIVYEGTIAEWGAITKKMSWAARVRATKVTCADGEVDM